MLTRLVHRFTYVGLAALLVACGSSSDGVGDDSTGTGGGDRSGAGGATGTGGTTGGQNGGPGGASGSVGGSSASGGSANAGGSAGASAGGSFSMGGPGCGLDAAAFCETFDAPSTVRGRAGDLDPTKWSASRGNAQLPTGNGVVIAAGPATVPACRAGLPAQVYPSDDTIICDPTDSIASKHLLVAVGSQNYGQNSYRIRQPFDFAGRTGKIVFDAEAFLFNSLIGWISVEVTEDPTPIPGFAIGSKGQTNDDGTAVPRNAFEIQFEDWCAGSMTPHFALRLIDVLQNYQDTLFTPMMPTCITSGQGKLNHFEIRVSQQRIEVYASPVSSDGVHFDPVQLLYGADVNLPFSRGYVQITTHNHASLKYSGPGSGFGAMTKLDAWLARWDNVGFDGPVVKNWREYEIPDSLVPGMHAWNIMGPVMSYGYVVADTADGPKNTFHFKGVKLDGVTGARLAMGNWYNVGGGDPLAPMKLQYRLNGHAWHDRSFTADEIAVLTNGHAQGSIAQMMDVPVTDLVEGDNTLELVTVNVSHNYPPAASAIDLVLTTK
jgi:hypothetical protein